MKTSALFVALALCFSLADMAMAQDKVSEKPEEVLDKTIQKVLSIVTNPDYSVPEKKPALREEVRSIIMSIVDMERLSSLVLANYKSKFSDEQFREFSDCFAKILFSIYIGNLDGCTDQKVVIEGVDELSPGRVRVKTNTLSETDAQKMPAEYSMTKRNSDGQWAVYDVRLEGMSFVSNYRSQFREILLKKTPAQLIEQMRRKVEDLQNTAPLTKIDEKLF